MFYVTTLTSAYGLSSWIEKLVAAANRAAAESLPTLPTLCQSRSRGVGELRYPIRSYCILHLRQHIIHVRVIALRLTALQAEEWWLHLEKECSIQLRKVVDQCNSTERLCSREN